MTALRHLMIGAGLSAFEATGLHRAAPASMRGKGAILTFHRVRRAEGQDFSPNALLEITPEFLDTLLAHVKGAGYEIVALDDVLPRLRSDNSRRFLALTFDDGYRDTLTEALPVLSRHAAPFTVFATTGFLDRTARLWWIELERALAQRDDIEVEVGGRMLRLRTDSPSEKDKAFRKLRRLLLAGDDVTLLETVDRLGASAGVDPRDVVAEACLDWNGLRALLGNPLATLGCHTCSHPRLALLADDALERELRLSRRILQERLDRTVHHLCYPYGMAQAAGEREFAAAAAQDFTTAVTTRPGVLFPEHVADPTALPRLSVNGLWQRTGVVDILLSGAPFALAPRPPRSVRAAA